MDLHEINISFTFTPAKDVGVGEMLCASLNNATAELRKRTDAIRMLSQHPRARSKVSAIHR